MALSEEKIVEIVETEFENAMGAPGDDISQERARAYDYFLRKLFGHEEEGESSVVTSDVADVIDGLMPQLLRMFTTQDNLLSFDPVGPEDEAEAEQNSDYISYVFFKRNPSFEIMFYWMFDALVQKVGYVKAYWDTSEEIEYESYEGLSKEELVALQDDEELEELEVEEREAMTVEMVQLPSQATLPGQPAPAPQMIPVEVEATVYDAKFRRVTTKGRQVVENVPPEEIRISNDTRSVDPSGARMVGHERDRPRHELLAMGFDKKKVMELPATEEGFNTEEAARRDKSDDQTTGGEPSDDKSQDMIKLREAYIRIDADEDGRAELKQVYIANGKLLEMNDFDRQPFHAICPHPLPHKHFGMSAADKHTDTQLITSTLLRQVLDNLYHTNRPGHFVWEQGLGETTMDDLLTRRVGRVATFRRPVSESYQPDAVPFTAGESFPMLEYFDKVKRDRSGVSADSEALTPDALKNIQTSVMAQARDVAQMKVEAIARVFAETGFKTLFLHLHELTMKHQEDVEILKLRGEWVQVDPRSWRTRRDMTVNIGLGIGSREQNLMHLQSIKEMQREMVEGGLMGVTVKPKHIYNTASEMVKNANYKLPEMFFEDPGEINAPPPRDEQLELQKQQQEIEQRRQQLDAQRQQIEQAKLQLKAQEDAAKHQREMLKLEEQREAREDKMSIENEKLRNELQKIGIELSEAQAERIIKRSTAMAQVGLMEAQAEQAEALAEKTRAEAEAAKTEAELAESGINELVDRIDDETE